MDSTRADRNCDVVVVATISRTVQAFLLPFISDLVDSGLKVAVCCNTSSGETQLIEKLGVELLHIPFSRRPLALVSHLRAFRQLRGLLRERNPRLVETHTPIASTLARLATDRSRASTVYFAHGFHFHEGSLSPSERLWLRIERRLARRTDAIITINEHDRSLAAEALPYAPEQVHKLDGVGIDLHHFPPAPLPAEPTVAVVGALIANKRPLDAVFSIAESECRRVVFAGDGPLEDQTIAAAVKAGLEVEFPGRVDDVRPVFASSSVLLFLSEREGLPRTVLEAVAMGRPIVAMGIRGVTDILQGQPWWFEPESRDPRDVATALSRALTYRPDTGAMRSSIERFDASVVTAAHTRLLTRLLGTNA